MNTEAIWKKKKVIDIYYYLRPKNDIILASREVKDF